MARRFQEITEVYRQEIAALARADRWAAFLRSACRNYKLPFEEQVLVHAQRPDATAVLEIERWNRQFGRWVNKGASPQIAETRSHCCCCASPFPCFLWLFPKC